MASFVDEKTIRIEGNSEPVEITGDWIYINTGADSFIPPIDGLKDSSYVQTSTTLMDLEELPKRLVIIGGGYIGLEFSSYYTNFGSQVTILQDKEAFIPREDHQMAEAVYDSLIKRGVNIIKSAEVTRIEDESNFTKVFYYTPEGEQVIAADQVLVATGRRPKVDGLNLEAAGVKLTDRGAAKVDEHLVTSQPHILALGDVRGGLQFTYISLDDYRIARDTVTGKKERTTENRGQVPYTVFLDPPLSRVGITEEEAKEQGLDYQVVTLDASAIPKTHILNQTTGLLKVLVEKGTDLIVGAHFFSAESYEIINLIKRAMDDKTPYQVLRDAIYTHPTMSEALNDLFQGLE